MNLDEFRIYLDNRSCSYFPGESVTGKVVTRISKKATIKGLQVTFVGRVFVQWTEQRTEYSHNPPQGTGIPKQSGVVPPTPVQVITNTYSHTECLFDFEQYLLGDGNKEITLEPGKSSHAFSFQLPSTNLPSTFVGRHGKVEYLMVASMKKSWYKSDFRTYQFVTINSIVDLNKDAVAGQPGEWADSKSYCSFCCTRGPLAVKIRTETRGYCPGGVMTLEVEANNLSTKKVSAFSAALLQEATFYAQNHRKVVEKAVYYKKKALPVDPGDSEIWRTKIQIPRVPPTSTGGCRSIDLQYALYVSVHVAGFSSGLSQRCPVIIGTVPLGDIFDADDVPAPPLLPVRSAPPYATWKRHEATIQKASTTRADRNGNFQRQPHVLPSNGEVKDENETPIVSVDVL